MWMHNTHVLFLCVSLSLSSFVTFPLAHARNTDALAQQPEATVNDTSTPEAAGLDTMDNAETDVPATPEPATTEMIIVDEANASPDTPKPTDAELDELFKIPIGFFNPPQIVMLVVLNSLGPTGGLLNVHCKSKDDDLGVHAKPNQVAFINQFTPNIWMTTLYSCHVWTDKFGGARFEAYKAKRDYGRCPWTCAWQATPSGIYGYKQLKDGKPEHDIFLHWSK